MNKTLNDVKHAHFIGIGGIGLSAIARMFILRGVEVSGTDIAHSHATDELLRLGAVIQFDQQKSSITDDVDLVLYTIAIPENNPELLDAKQKGIATLTYPEALGLISKTHKTIAISGTHGKTTTTAMTAEALIRAGLDPTVVVGSFLKSSGSNFIPGKSDLFVVEACEYRESFSHLTIDIWAITNIEEDHLDYYKDINDIISAFNRVALKIPEDGFIVADPRDSVVQKVLANVRAQVIDYTNVLEEVKLSIPGAHNRKNAAIALSIARILGADEREVKDALEEFNGTWRRFEKKGEMKEGTIVYDDYAHHPTEIKATLQAFREAFPKKKIVVIFQPHLFSRTKLLFDNFAKSFSDADEVVIVPIYKAREEDDGTISSDMLALEMAKNHTNVKSVGSFEDALTYVRAYIREHEGGCAVITLGAGDVYKIAEILVSRPAN